jgi:hypothetical protein
VGVVSDVQGNSVTVKNDASAMVLAVNKATQIWRGGSVPLAQLRRGDAVMIWYASTLNGGKTAVAIAANLSRLAGTITAVDRDGFVFVGDGGPGEASGRVRVLVDRHTMYAQGAPQDIKVGRDLEVTGLDMGHKRMKAAALNIWPLQ